MRVKTRTFEVILAEDNPADAELVLRALIEHEVNCVLHVTRDGADAIQKIQSLDTDPKAAALDMLILDMHLPKCDGEEILTALRSTAHASQTPVIVLARTDPKMIREQGEGFPALIFFEKPSELDEFMKLGALVRSVLSGDKIPLAGESGTDLKSASMA